MEDTATYLESHGIKPTAVRMVVWDEVKGQSETFSLADMEARMVHMDRSSIFRTLKLFAEHHLLHVIDDGSGLQKYCVCRCGHDSNGNGSHINHVHFTCTSCGKTYCLEDYAIPVVDLPEGFTMEEVEYIIKGTCKKCSTQ